MCESCYREIMGDAPPIRTAATENAARLIARVYEHSGVGGNGHNVLDDWNLDDDDIRWCLDVACERNDHESEPDDLEAERAALRALLALPTYEERMSACAMEDPGAAGLPDEWRVR